MAAHQALPSLGFSRQEHWSGLPFPSPINESEKWKWSHSVVSNSLRPHGPQPTRLLCPWDSSGKSAGVGCHCLLQNCYLVCSKLRMFSVKHIDWHTMKTVGIASIVEKLGGLEPNRSIWVFGLCVCVCVCECVCFNFKILYIFKMKYSWFTMLC